MRRKQQPSNDEEKQQKRGSNWTEAGLQTFPRLIVLLSVSIATCERVECECKELSFSICSSLAFRFFCDLCLTRVDFGLY